MGSTVALTVVGSAWASCTALQETAESGGTVATEVDWVFVVACGEIFHHAGDAPRLAIDGGYYYYGDGSGEGWGDGVFHGDTRGNNMDPGYDAEGSYVLGVGNGVSWYR
jgi:hypothetical protein